MPQARRDRHGGRPAPADAPLVAALLELAEFGRVYVDSRDAAEWIARAAPVRTRVAGVGGRFRVEEVR